MQRSLKLWLKEAVYVSGHWITRFGQWRLGVYGAWDRSVCSAFWWFGAGMCYILDGSGGRLLLWVAQARVIHFQIHSSRSSGLASLPCYPS